jgi:hypothetical protein
MAVARFCALQIPLSSPLQHISKEPVNEIEEFQLLLNKAIKALNSVLTVVHRYLPAPATTEGPSFLGLRVSTSAVTSNNCPSKRKILKIKKKKSCHMKHICFLTYNFIPFSFKILFETLCKMCNCFTQAKMFHVSIRMFL